MKDYYHVVSYTIDIPPQKNDVIIMLEQKLTNRYAIPTKVGRYEKFMPTKIEFMPTKW